MVKKCIFLVFVILIAFTCFALENNKIDENEKDFEYLLKTGLADIFPDPVLGENGVPICLPIDQITPGLYLNNVNPNNDFSLPKWFNKSSALIGQKFVRDNFFAVFHGHLFFNSLQVIVIPNLGRLLFYTGSFSEDNAVNGARRLMATLLQQMIWFTGDMEQPCWLDSLSNVRAIHETVAYKARTLDWDVRKPLDFEAVPRSKPIAEYFNEKMWAAFTKDVAPYKAKYPLSLRSKIVYDGTTNELPINQLYQLGVSAILVCPPLLFPRLWASPTVTQRELQGYVDLMAGINYLLGLDDSYNIALSSGGLEGTTKYCRDIFEQYTIPALVHVDETIESKLAAEGYIDSIILMAPTGLNTKEGWLHLALTLAGIPAHNLQRLIGVNGQIFRRMYWSGVEPLLRTRWGKTTLNYYFRLFLRVNSLKYFGFDGTNFTQVAEKAFFTGKNDKKRKL